MRSAFMLFLSLGLGYILCVIAKKQEGVLKTLGYSLGVSILVLSFAYGLLSVDITTGIMGKIGKNCFMMPKCPMTKAVK